MKKYNSEINKLVHKVLKESLEERADELTQTVKQKMEEIETDIHNSPDDITDEENLDYVQEKLSRECKDPSSESCKKHKKYAGLSSDEIGEELIGGQRKLDKNKNGKLDAEDFKMLRNKKEEPKEGFFSSKDSFFSHDFGNDSEEEIFRKPKKIHPAHQKVRKGYEPEDIEWEDVDDDNDEEMREGNVFTDALRKTKKGEKFKVGGKTYTDTSNLDETSRFIKKVYNEVLNEVKKKVSEKNKSKESLQLTEEEMIDLIEKIVKEEKKYAGKKPQGLTQTEKVLTADKKQNDDYIKSVTKKMKEYLKNGSKGEYKMDTKDFPMTNGQMAKMEKKGYSPDDVTQEYIDNFTSAGLENLVYDEIHPNEDWVSDNIEGSSKTGNNPEWANAVETGLGKNKNKQRKENLLGAVKQMAYNKAPQPVTNDNSSGRKGKFEKNFGKESGKKAIKILNQLESTPNKKEKLITEEFERINQLIDYTKNTQ